MSTIFEILRMECGCVFARKTSRLEDKFVMVGAGVECKAKRHVVDEDDFYDSV